jgi:hypothetical protein
LALDFQAENLYVVDGHTIRKVEIDKGRVSKIKISKTQKQKTGKIPITEIK